MKELVRKIAALPPARRYEIVDNMRVKGNLIHAQKDMDRLPSDPYPPELDDLSDALFIAVQDYLCSVYHAEQFHKKSLIDLEALESK